MATQANPWDADPVVSTGKNPWDADPVVASPAAPARASNPRLDKITSFATETDKLLGLTPGTSLAQLTQESRLRDDATSPVGAEGVAQVMPTTKATLEKRLGRPLNSRNTDDALVIHREVMRENMQKFGNRDDALRAYNAGWDKNRWGNPETSAYVDKINGRMGIPAAEGAAYKAFATIRKDIDQKTLNTDQDWLKASALLYELWEKKPYEGTSQDDLAEWGKNRLGYFNFNTIDMGRIAYAVSKGSQEQKEAFLYMMDTYDETDISWEGAGRAAKGILTDPLNLVGLGTMGIGFGAKMAARNASKEAAKLLVKQSMLQGVKDAVVTGAVRTGVVAGMEGAIYGGAQSVVKQGVEVSAGRREEISTGKTVVDAATGAAAGLVLGTGLDVVASKALPAAARAVNNIRDMFRGTPKEAPTVTSRAASGNQPTAEGITLYHGSPHEYTKFDASKIGTGEGAQAFGKGIYLADSENIAIHYRDVLSKAPDTLGSIKNSATRDIAASWIDNAGGDRTKAANDFKDFWQSTGQDTNDVLFQDTLKSIESPEGYLYKIQLSKEASGRMLDWDAPIDKQDAYTRKIIKELFPDLPDGTTGAELVKKLGADAGGTLEDDLQKRGVTGIKYLNGVSRDGKGTGNNYVIFPGNESLIDVVARNGELPKSKLTPDEILAAQARQQDGRLPEDQIAPDMTGAPDNLITLPNIENTGGRTTRVNGEPVAKVTKADVEAQAQTIVDQLKALSNDDLPIALEQLRTGKFTMEEQRVVASALRLHSDELAVAAKEAIVARDSLLGKTNRTPEEELRLQEVTAKAEEILARMATPSLTDDAFGSMAGTVLSDRRNAGPGASKITVESIMAERGITRDEALTVWAEVTAKLEQDAAIQKVADGYEAKIAAARDAGDMDEVAKLSVQKGREMAAMGEDIAPGAAGFVEKLKETAISNVFTATTVQVNFVASAVKTAITPTLRFVFGNDYSKAARSELAGSYSAMRSSFGAAVAGARTAYRLEQALLTRDSTRLVDGELALNDSNKLFKWVPAGAIRFLPRVLNSSDEFLSRLAYDSYVSGKAAAEAAIDGAEKGLKGKDLDAFIEQASEKALDAARTVSKGEDIIQPVVNKGVNKGLTGDELWDWVEKEVMRNPDALRKGVDEDALAYVRDLLYKRQFSGEGRASKIAQLYEKGAKAVPAWALVTGQLFFRTPIRVFEEGVRLTPGLQLIAPGFFDDLSGKNGMARQVKAQAESMTSLAVAGAVISLYSQGRITGDGDYSDFKQGKNRTDGPLQAPYTIKMSDGSTWSYKLFDPLSTPVKIMVNALERADKLRLKQSQGEDIPDSKIEEAYSHVTVGIAAVLTAIKDANLVTGARMTAEIFTNAEDIEKNESRWLKLLGEKMFLLVPNTLHKIAKDNDPSIRDPADFWQMVEEKLARPLGLDGSTKVVTSKAYDVLGNVRRPADTGTLWNIFSTSSIEEQTKGMSPESQAIMIETDRLARTTGATFKAPIKHPSLGDLDLRTVMAADGKRTLYDVWQDNYKALKPEVPLYELATSDLPDGTFKNRGVKAAAMQDLMGKFQEAAFAQLRVEEGDVINAQIDKVLRNKALSKSGAFDSKLPY